MINYTFTFDEHTSIAFDVEVTSDTSAEDPAPPFPAWLALDSHRCDECSLPAGARRTCPAAVSIRPVVEAFSTRLSYETVHVTVRGDHGRTETTLAIQDALRSVVGLLLALSGCPVLSKLRPMAHYHLPFGSREHTMYRFVGTTTTVSRTWVSCEDPCPACCTWLCCLTSATMTEPPYATRMTSFSNHCQNSPCSTLSSIFLPVSSL